MKFSVIAFCLLMWVAGCTRPVAKPAVTVPSPAMIAFLQGLTDQCAEKELNVFFISPVLKMEDARRVYVYWMTDNSILPLSWPLEQVRDSNGYLSEYARRMDLASGVVPAHKDIGSSTYLTDSDWVAARLRECVGSGTKLLVHKKTDDKRMETNRR